jgi:tetratricopeptide (TPR) repeat protein
MMPRQFSPLATPINRRLIVFRHHGRMPSNSAEVAAIYTTGLTELRAGRAAEAVATLRRVLNRAPTHAGARRNLVRALMATGEHEAVIIEATAALRDAPESGEMHFHRGTAFNALSRPLDACEALAASVTINPNFAPAWLNLGNAHMDLDHVAEAETYCRRALTIDPDLIEAKVSLGFILTARGRLAEAIEVLEAAIQTNPGHVQAHWNLATATLLAGDLPRGFAEYEWRKRLICQVRSGTATTRAAEPSSSMPSKDWATPSSSHDICH